MLPSTPAVTVLPVTFEQHHNGFGVQCDRPRLSWRFSSRNDALYGWKQTAYDVEIIDNDRNTIETFQVKSADSVLVPWPCSNPLNSRARCTVRVRCYSKYSIFNQIVKDAVTEWSEPSQLEIALLHQIDWMGKMITPSKSWPVNTDGSARPLCFNKSFDLSNMGDIARARLYITSHGVYTAMLNGCQIGDQCMAPGCQSYHKRLHYQIYDIKDQLKSSSINKIGVEVAAGWFASACSWANNRFVYGKELGVSAQLEIWFQDSSTPFTVCTDPSWMASTTATISSEIYNGETYDQRLNMRPNHQGQAWSSTQESTISVARLVSPEAPPVRVIDRLKPNKIFRSNSGKIIIDFGQNMAGRLLVTRVQKPRDSVILFRHAEVLEKGELAVQPLRSAKATDTLICDGSEILNWHPRYTYHGFRFVEITGWTPDDQDCPLTTSSIVAEVLHSDMIRTGWFKCSDKEVSRLHENALWGMKSNFFSIPTECPSRDERYGWTGDLNIFAPTANFLYDTTGFLSNWLDDLYADQMEESQYWRKGVVPLFSPNCMLKQGDGRHGWDPLPNGVWGDAATMIPRGLYYLSNDKRLLSAQYDSMIQYLAHGVVRGVDGLWDPEQFQLGDWLDPRAPTNDSGRGTTDGTFVADCFLIRSTQIVAEVAALLGHTEDCARYGDQAKELLRAWQDKYLSTNGLVVPDTATALSLAIVFDLVPGSGRGLKWEQAAQRLSRVVRLNDFKITTGFVGTAFITHALSRVGRVDLAYAILFQKSSPSFLYPVRMGATTIWERWNSLLPDGSVNPGSMTSYNHHALGSIANWLHVDVGGLEAIEPGWKVFRVRPRPNRELTWADIIFESRYGRIELSWTLEAGIFRCDLLVPPNSTALVVLPAQHAETREQQVGSGKYQFECRFVQPEDWHPQALLPPWGRAEF